jgi:hypothetical protein
LIPAERDAIMVKIPSMRYSKEYRFQARVLSPGELKKAITTVASLVPELEKTHIRMDQTTADGTYISDDDVTTDNLDSVLDLESKLVDVSFFSKEGYSRLAVHGLTQDFIISASSDRADLPQALVHGFTEALKLKLQPKDKNGQKLQNIHHLRISSASKTKMEDDFRDRPFALGPEHLGKIREIIQRRAGDGKWICGATRSDGFQLATKDLNELLTDERLNEERLTHIGLDFEGEAISVDVRFRSSSHQPVSLNVVGVEHDDVLLLTSALRRYINTEVLIRRAPGWIGGIVSLVIVIAVVTFVFRSHPHDPTFESVLQSQDVAEKLNYLLQHGSHQGVYVSNGACLLVISMFVVAFFLIPHFFFSEDPIIFRHLYPKNLFLFGPTAALFKKRAALRRNLFWSGIVAIAMSLFAGILLKLFG